MAFLINGNKAVAFYISVWYYLTLNALIRTVDIRNACQRGPQMLEAASGAYVEDHLGAASIASVDYVIIILKWLCYQGN